LLLLRPVIFGVVLRFELSLFALVSPEPVVLALLFNKFALERLIFFFTLSKLLRVAGLAIVIEFLIKFGRFWLVEFLEWGIGYLVGAVYLPLIFVFFNQIVQ
jgi:hypothetical protein